MQRRSFIKNAVAASAGTLAASASSKAAQSRKNQFGMGAKIQLPAVQMVLGL